ncbi:COF family HAD hydrolase protein [Mycoplasmopsis californica]|uniref:HAD family hydrolase n=1 Tax=Mycoplasmopsis equigenitalium TaxID=114883 RepID=A0ABY5J1Z8_9BACT|nr:Cof-type HAD-IIB family hydrolase [Mycoplasmopsis equigenitalium]UUD37249.1 HAD family hydrolase [Mycoplasmopsis equigenitalium]VEU69443.1 COF family HAD hydrolase protein [Mycoplasmopsis californica]
MNKNIIFLDLDGTTLNDKHGKKLFVSDANIKAIKAAKKHFRFVISTGRPFRDLSVRVMKALELDDIIYWNGASAVVDNKVIVDKPMAANDANAFIKYAKANKLNIVFESNKKDTYFRSNWLKMFSVFVKGAYVRHIKRLDEDKIFYKALVFGHTRKKLQQIYDFVNSLPNTICVFSGSRSHYLEITHKEATKGLAEVAVANYYQVDPKDCIHIGDTMNDGTCKGYVGKLIAVGNASSALKEIADEVYDVCAKDDAIKYILKDLINKKNKQIS